MTRKLKIIHHGAPIKTKSLRNEHLCLYEWYMLKENAKKGIFITQTRTVSQHYNIIDIHFGL